MTLLCDEEVINKFGGKQLFKIYEEAVGNFFKGASPAHKRTYSNDILSFKNGLHEYLMDIYILFYDIYKIEELYGNIVEEQADYEKLAKFIKAIYYHRIRQGSKINRYVAGVSLPKYVKRLIKVCKDDNT